MEKSARNTDSTEAVDGAWGKERENLLARERKTRKKERSPQINPPDVTFEFGGDKGSAVQKKSHNRGLHLPAHD